MLFVMSAKGHMFGIPIISSAGSYTCMCDEEVALLCKRAISLPHVVLTTSKCSDGGNKMMIADAGPC